VGATTEYVVNITNRGSKAAENIDVGVYFSDAIEPISAVNVEGGRAKVNIEGREVIFDKIPVLSAREKLTYRIKCRGLDSGNHRVKAILVCQSTETELNTQVMSRFYQGRSSKASPNSVAGETQFPRGNTTSLAQRNPMGDDSRSMPSSNSPVMTPGVPTMSRPGTTTQQGTQAMSPMPVNPLANPGSPSPANSGGLTSNRMQGATVGNDNTVPNMQVPDNFGKQPISAPTPTLGPAPGRSQRTTSIPALPAPPVVGTTN
jgi:hypothetical protein